MKLYTRKNTGFTLIELMIVVAILGTLASVAVPKFGSMIRRAKESRVKGNLGTLRSSISMYYASNEGMNPQQLTLDDADEGWLWGHKGWTLESSFAEYLNSQADSTLMPVGHEGVKGIEDGDRSYECVNIYNATESDPGGDRSGWVYYRPSGRIMVNSTSTDIIGSPLTSW